jgi:hypothetical protein
MKEFLNFGNVQHRRLLASPGLLDGPELDRRAIPLGDRLSTTGFPRRSPPAPTLD